MIVHWVGASLPIASTETSSVEAFPGLGSPVVHNRSLRWHKASGGASADDRPQGNSRPLSGNAGSQTANTDIETSETSHQEFPCWTPPPLGCSRSRQDFGRLASVLNLGPNPGEFGYESDGHTTPGLPSPFLHQTMSHTKSICLAAIILAIVVCAFFFEVATLRGTFFYFDITEINYPFRFYLGQQLKHGCIPLWTPHILAGFPFLAEGQAGPLYPPNLVIFSLLPAWIGLSYSTIGHFWLAGVLMFAYLRLFTRRFSSTLLGSMVFVFGGFMVTRAIHTNLINATPWLPLIMYLVERGLRDRRNAWLVAAGLAYAVQILAGHVQFAAFTWLAASAYCLIRETIASSEARDAWLRRSWRIIGPPVIMAAAGALLTSAQLLPTYELTCLSRRAASRGAAFVSQVSFPPENAITFLFPSFFGNLATDTDWSALPFHEACGYLGVLALLLIVLACLRRRDKAVCIHFALLVLVGLIMLGGYSVTSRLIAFVPVLNRMRGLARMLGVFAFAASTLVALGHDYLLTPRDATSKARDVRVLRWTAGVLAFAGLCMLLHTYLDFGWKLDGVRSFTADPTHLRYAEDKLFRLRHAVLTDVCSRLALLLVALAALVWALKRQGRLARWVLVLAPLALTAIDLFTFGSRCNPVAPDSVYDEPPAVTFLKQQPNVFRTYSDESYHVWKYPGWQASRRPYDDITSVLGENMSLLYGVQSLNGEVPLEYERLWKLKRSDPSLALDVLNVRYVLSRADDWPGTLRFEQCIARVYERPTALPRAFVLQDPTPVRHVRDQEEDGRAASERGHPAPRGPSPPRELRGARCPRSDGGEPEVSGCALGRQAHTVPRFDPHQTVMIEEGAQRYLFAGTRRALGDPRVLRYSPHGVGVSLPSGSSGERILVLTDAHYPGWRAYADGVPTQILPANYCTRAVRTSPRTRQVAFVFEPQSFRLGAAVSLLSVASLASLACAWCIGRAGRGKRIASPDSGLAPGYGSRITVLALLAAVVIVVSLWTQRTRWRLAFQSIDECDRIEEFVEPGQLEYLYGAPLR